MPGVYVDRVHKLSVQNGPEEAAAMSVGQKQSVEQISAPVLHVNLQKEAMPAAAKAMIPLRNQPVMLAPRAPHQAKVTPAHAELKTGVTRENTMNLDRDTELTLVLLGAALLMWGYAPFSIIGYLIVFVASVLGASLVHALIWGERMDWGKTRLGRVALSLVISGVVLTGVMALVADILGLVF